MWAELREYLSAKPAKFERINALLSKLSAEARMEALSYIHAHEPKWSGAWPEGTQIGQVFATHPYAEIAASSLSASSQNLRHLRFGQLSRSR